MKEEPCEEDPKPAQPKGPPGFPQDVSAAELLQRLSLAAEEELVFLQLPDTLPGQPPTHDSKPIKSELHNEDGQVVVVKQEKSQVGALRWGRLLILGWDRSPPVVSSPLSPRGCSPIPWCPFPSSPVLSPHLMVLSPPSHGVIPVPRCDPNLTL